MSFFKMIALQQTSYLNWAWSVSKEIGKTVSKQAIFKRMNNEWLCLMQALLEKALQQHLRQNINKPVCSVFKNIYLQDSTSIGLPDMMNKIFPSNIVGGILKATAKVNTILNVASSTCHSFSILPFKNNEQSLSSTVFDYATKGDLVIRDLGYYSLEVFQQMCSKSIYFISRQKFGVSVFDPQTKKKLSLINILKKHKGSNPLDIQVLCGKKQKVAVRLIAVKLDEKTANEKRKKARQHRDKRFNHTDEYYFLLGYAIFITNVQAEHSTATQIADLYTIRWQIEILFKSWKSGFKMVNLIPDAQHKCERIHAVIYMLLIYITWFEQKLLKPINEGLHRNANQNISILKLTKYIVVNQNDLLHGCSLKHIKHILYWCCYEKRRRVNARQLSNQILTGFG